MDTSPISANKQNNPHDVKDNSESKIQNTQSNDSPALSDKSIEHERLAEKIQNNSGGTQNLKNEPVNGDSAFKPWVNEIVTSNGDLLHLKHNAKHLSDGYNDSNDFKSVYKTAKDEQEESNKNDDARDEEKENHLLDGNVIEQENREYNNVQHNEDDSNNVNSENMVPEQNIQKSSNNYQSARNAENLEIQKDGADKEKNGEREQMDDEKEQMDDEREHKNNEREQTINESEQTNNAIQHEHEKEQGYKEEKGHHVTEVKREISSEEHINDEKKQEENHNTNQINKDSETIEGKGEKRLLDSRRFEEIRNHYVSKYLDDHYKGKEISKDNLQEITNMITEDLKEQWKMRESDILATMVENDKQDKRNSMREENKHTKSNTENSQTEEKQHTSRSESDDQNESMDVPKQEERQGMDVPKQDERQRMDVPKQDERQGMDVPKHEERQGMDVPKLEERQDMDVAKHEERQGKDVPKHEERQDMDIAKHEERQDMDVAKHEERQDMDVPKHEERQEMDVPKHEERQDMDVSKHEERQNMDVPKHGERQDMDVTKHDERQDMDVAKHEERQEMDVAKHEERQEMDVLKHGERQSMEVAKHGERRSIEVAKEEENTFTGEDEDKSTSETFRRTGKSFLSSMVRSSLLLVAHEKSHDSSITTERSSFSSVTMVTGENSRSDMILSTVSASTSDIVSPATSQADNNHITSNEIDDTGSVDFSKTTDNTYTDMFSKLENNEVNTNKVPGDNQSSIGKDVESDSKIKNSIEPFENEIKQEMDINTVEVKNLESMITKGKLIKAGDPFNLSIMFDSDPTANKLIQSPMFQKLRKQQVDSYIDAQFEGKDMSEDELKYVDGLISRSMQKDLNAENSDLFAWLQDNMSDSDAEDTTIQEEADKQAGPDKQQMSHHQEKPHQEMHDHQEKPDHKEKSEHEEKHILGKSDEVTPTGITVTNDKSESVDNGVFQDMDDLTKSKRNKLINILKGAHHNSSQHQGNGSSDATSAESIISEETQIDKDPTDDIARKNIQENEKEEEEVKGTDDNTITEGDVKREENAKGYLDSIWNFFGGSSGNTASTEIGKDSNEKNISEEEIIQKKPTSPDSKEDKDKDEDATKSDIAESLIISPAEDFEGEEEEDVTESHHEDNILTMFPKPLETSTDISTEADQEDATTISRTISNDSAAEGSKPIEVIVTNKTSEFLDVIISKASETEKVTTSSLPPTMASTTSTTITNTTTIAATTETTRTTSPEEAKVIDKLTVEDFKPTEPSSSFISESVETPKPIPKIIESVDIDEEKLKYKEAGTCN